MSGVEGENLGAQDNVQELNGGSHDASPLSPGAASIGSDQQGEQELDSKMLQIQSKRFYLDVKQNRRGRFIKIAEVGAGGRKSRLLLSMSNSAEFRDHLIEFQEFYESLGPPNPDNVPEDGKLKSSHIAGGTRRYYLDLKENQRGRFLRVSQTQTRGGPRSQIAIPAQGMDEFKETLSGLLDLYGTDDHETSVELPESKSMRVENKMFYFDIGQNNRGTYMRISEVRSNFRTAITIPERAWPRLRDIIGEYLDKVEEGPGPAESGDAPAITDEAPAE